MTLLDPIRAEAVDGRVQITMPTTLLRDLLCDLAEATGMGGDHVTDWDDLACAVHFADKPDDFLRDWYSEDAPQPITAEKARELAESERDEALAAITRVIDLAQLRIRPAEARRLANALILAAYHAERQAS